MLRRMFLDGMTERATAIRSMDPLIGRNRIPANREEFSRHKSLYQENRVVAASGYGRRVDQTGVRALVPGAAGLRGAGCGHVGDHPGQMRSGGDE